MWIVILTSVCSLVILLTATMLCLCWRKKTQKNDLLGLEGLVTQKNPDENVNHLPSAICHIVPEGFKNASDESVDDANKRSVTVSNSRRSLPDIPSDGIRVGGDVIAYEPNGDNSSDLYATVEPYQNTVKRHTLPNGTDTQPSISQHSSLSQADETFSPYARVKEHPYDRLKAEHPYACVQPSNNQGQEENSSGEATPRTVVLRNERACTGQAIGEHVAPCRSRRSSTESGARLDIPAASAVAGSITANQELPYMTPPINQTNFSGDSQDSSKGYTSISVREPLANIRAQTKVLNKMQGDLDAHYSTVSDDSDDMYTTIQEPVNPVYTSGSETYAQIQPLQLTVEVELNANANSDGCQKDDDLVDPMYERAPQPPSVDSLKHVTHTHSRQASSSSSVGNLGSPKPEKRQANSPLPPPPSTLAASSLSNVEYLNIDKPQILKNLDDMYAKVQKTRRKTTERLDQDLVPSNESTCCSKLNNDINTSEEHNYETLRKSSGNCAIDPGYEKLKSREDDAIAEPGYDSISGPDSILSSDPGYEVLKHGLVSFAGADPNYEELKDRKVEDTNSVEDGYSIVNKVAKHNSLSEEVKSKSSSSYESDPRESSTDEPNYESMPSESISEHNYSILKSTGSESDPNYESVNNNDPNYESVKYLDVSMEEPPYEKLQEDDSSKSDSNPSYCNNVANNSLLDDVDIGYEKVKAESKLKKSYANGADPDYETIRNERGDSGSCNAQQGDYDEIVQV